MRNFHKVKESQGLSKMNDNRVRISDIAEELGLSTATVSYVLHGKTDKVSDRTARRVLALLEERGYLPGVADILLGQNSSRIVGVVVNDHEKYEDHPFKKADRVWLPQLSASLNYRSFDKALVCIHLSG